LHRTNPDFDRNPMKYFSFLGDQCQEDMNRTLNHAPSAAHVAQVVMRANRLFDETVDSQPFSPPMACKSGCIHCCYNPIPLSQPEAVLLGLHLLDRFTASELHAIDLRTKAVSSRIKGMDVKALGKIRHELPCPLLMDGTCGVHPVRPLACRGWNSVSAEQCAASNTQGPMTMIENYEWPRTLADVIQSALLHGARKHGLEVGFLRLPNALSLMMRHGIEKCAADWLRKNAFFGRGG